MRTEQRTIIYEGIDAVRDSQDRKWGGPAHDDKHTRHDWIAFAVKQLGKAMEYNASPGDFNSAMIQAAAVCVAAVESNNRAGWD